MVCHAGDRFGHAAGGSTHASVREEDDFAPGRKRIDDGRIPIIQRTGEMLKEKQRTAQAATQAAIGIPYLGYLEELRRCVDAAGAVGRRRGRRSKWQVARIHDTSHQSASTWDWNRCAGTDLLDESVGTAAPVASATLRNPRDTVPA